MQNKAIICGKLFDAASKSVLNDRIILTAGDRVSAVVQNDGKTDLSGYEVIDLSDKFVSPGFIDCHVHLSMNGGGNDMTQTPYMTIGDYAFKALKNAQTDLLAGFTSLRIVGDPGYVDVSLKKAISRGDVVGPRLMPSGPCVGTTGGHADSHYNPYITESVAMGSIGDGPDGLIKATREVIKHGAELVKYMSTGGVMSAGTNVNAQQMSFDEMKAVIDTAKMYGLTTATHCHGTNGIKDAVRAGVTSVEHGTLIDDEGISLMREYGTYLVPTIIAGERICVVGKEMGAAEWMIEKSNQVHKRHAQSFRKCHEAGVKIAFGSDAGTPGNFHGKQTYEMELMHKEGMDVLEVLYCATGSAARLMGKEHEVGAIEPGKYADLVALDSDPREDIKAVNHCSFVMKGAVVYKQDGQSKI